MDSEHSIPLEPRGLYSSIKDAYLRYYDTAFWLRDESLRRERRDLLTREGAVFTDPLLEPVLPYEQGSTIREVCQRVGISSVVADKLGEMLFDRDGDFPLYRHQAEAFEAAIGRTGGVRNVVVTSGTGSGKTESFLLPIMARLLTEAESWPDPIPLHRWWDASLPAGSKWQGCRRNSPRSASLRTIILYPTNALVEDQMSRLRRAFMRALPPEGAGPPFFFGRYTGSTMGNKEAPKDLGVDRAVLAAEELRLIEKEALGLGDLDDEVLCQFSDPNVGELLTRWDMVATPPDILITNYSMLNVMLMRDIEEPMFDATRRWLDEDPEHVLTLVVDELHTYRGTQGSEVALVVRNLLSRLGIEPDSPQLSCIGTSASLPADDGVEYLEQFFGVPRETFAIVPGRTIAPPEFSEPLSRAVLQPLYELHDPAARAKALIAATIEHDLPRRVASACRVGEELRPRKITDIERALFGDHPPDAPLGGSDDMGLVLEALGLQESVPEGFAGRVAFRSHLFARRIPGMWACTNPTCSEVAEEYGYDERRIGRLYTSPVTTCGCGSRVLELLYCYQCGDVSLGGFIAEDMRAEDNWLLGPTIPGELDGPSDAHRQEWGRYMWYWPGNPAEAAEGSWNHNSPSKNRVDFTFVPAEMKPAVGLLRPAAPLGLKTGVMLSAQGDPGEHWKIPALPERCPRCGIEYYNGKMNMFFRGNVYSPIRGHAVGGTRITQVMLDRILRLSADGRAAESTIIFSDSRDRAASTAAGVEANHFRNMVRQLVVRELAADFSPVDLFKTAAAGRPLDTRELKELARLKVAHPDVFSSYRLAARGVADEEDLSRIADFESIHGGKRGPSVGWGAFLHRMQDTLLELGQNPAGPKAKGSRKKYTEL